MLILRNLDSVSTVYILISLFLTDGWCVSVSIYICRLVANTALSPLLCGSLLGDINYTYIALRAYIPNMIITYNYLYTYSMLSLHWDNKGFGDDDKLPCHFDYDLEGVSDEIGMLSVI